MSTMARFSVLPSARCFLVLLVLVVAGLCAATAPPAPIFEPTEEWKEIKPDEHLPGGLDIRIDFAAGKKYARLLPKADTTATAAVSVAAASSSDHNADTAVATGAALAVVPGDSVEHAAPTRRRAAVEAAPVPKPTVDPALQLDPAHADMLVVLSALPSPEASVDAALAAGLTGDALAKIIDQVWTRRQAELKEALASAKTEAQVLQGLLRDLEALGRGTGDGAGTDGADPVERVVTLLEDIEAVITHTHACEDFVHMGGVLVLTHMLNASDPRVIAATAWALGTATKYVPVAQQQALDLGAVPLLVRALTSALNALESDLSGGGWSSARVIASERAQLAASRIVYALGALLRPGSASSAAPTASASRSPAAPPHERALAQLLMPGVDGHHALFRAMSTSAMRALLRLEGARAVTASSQAIVPAALKDVLAHMRVAVMAKGIIAKVARLFRDVAHRDTPSSLEQDTRSTPDDLRVPITVLDGKRGVAAVAADASVAVSSAASTAASPASPDIDELLRVACVACRDGVPVAPLYQHVDELMTGRIFVHEPGCEDFPVPAEVQARVDGKDTANDTSPVVVIDKDAPDYERIQSQASVWEELTTDLRAAWQELTETCAAANV